MPQEYAAMQDLARAQGFGSFTPLQERAFQMPEAYDDLKDLFVIGETSSGKTLIPLLLYYLAVDRAKEQGKEYPKMLFVVPYRALAAQKLEEMKKFFRNEELLIVQSTGEYRQDDEQIQRGQVHIAVVITEKVYRYEAKDASFLSKYDYLVLDEVGLISSQERGIRLDFILAWAKNQKLQMDRPRIIALGTPFFDWSAYIESYQFQEIRYDKRPVDPEEISVEYTKTEVKNVDGHCSFLFPVRRLLRKKYQEYANRPEVPGTTCEWIEEGTFCPFTTPCRRDASLMCSRTGEPCLHPIEIVDESREMGVNGLLLKICREHLKQGHQILIFVNDRMKVVEHSRFLYDKLKEFLPAAKPVDECKRLLLEKCDLETDDLFGVMEHENEAAGNAEYYQAFFSGIGFHSAALPNELRTFVEERFLGSGEMRIVCSTETLAFGVNSSVDVVIVADLYKHDGGEVRPLSLNEYQNYCGRAGRLRKDAVHGDIKGYVYTLITEKQIPRWKEMKTGAAAPEKLFSLFHFDEGQLMPFFLLNLLPATGERGMTVGELLQTVQFLPRDGSVAEEVLEGRIRDSLQFLKEQELAAPIRLRSFGRGEREAGRAGASYGLTGLGSRLRGYILDRDDYLALQTASGEYLKGNVFLNPDKTLYLYRLLCTKHAASGLNSIFWNSESRVSDEQVREIIRGYAGKDDNSADWIENCRNGKTLFILAALLAWADGESPKFLYRQYGIHYALLTRLAEQIAYLIEITREILPSRMEAIYREKEAEFIRFGIGSEDFLETINERLEQIQDLFVSIYYGVNTGIIRELRADIPEGEADPKTSELLRELSLRSINPQIARKLRRIVIRYKFFADPPQADADNAEMRNNYLDQYRRYRRNVESWGPYVSAFFKKRFPDLFAVGNG